VDISKSNFKALLMYLNNNDKFHAIQKFILTNDRSGQLQK